MRELRDGGSRDRTAGFRIFGIVRDAKTGSGLDGYAVTAFDVDRGEEDEFLGRTFTMAGGHFFIDFSREDFVRSVDEETLEGGPDVLLQIANRFGHEIVQHGPLSDAERFLEVEIEVTVREELERPSGPRRIDPFEELADSYEKELEVLRSAGIASGRDLLAADLEAIADRHGAPLDALETLRLHTEMGHAKSFPREVASALVSAGLKTREQLAGAQPFEVVKAISGSVEGEYSNSTAYGWVGYAKGIEIDPFLEPIDKRMIIKDAERLIELVQHANPGLKVIAVEGLLNPFTASRRWRACARRWLPPGSATSPRWALSGLRESG